MKLRVRQILWGVALLAQALIAEGAGKNYYNTLGLKKNAKEDAIKKAYRFVSSLRQREDRVDLYLVCDVTTSTRILDRQRSMTMTNGPMGHGPVDGRTHGERPPRQPRQAVDVVCVLTLPPPSRCLHKQVSFLRRYVR